jgi:hypothetical protein
MVAPVDSVEHVGQLCRRDCHHAVGRRRPDEAPLLQPLGIQRHAQTVMPDDLDQIATTASEYEKIAGMGIALQRFLDLECQAIHAASHIGSSDRQPDPHAGRNMDELV